MDLESASGGIIKNATAEDVLALSETQAYAILSTGRDTYLQFGRLGTTPPTYEMEYQEGSIDRHFRLADGPIPFDQVIQAFLWYLKGDSSWQKKLRWEPMRLR
ncbi:MAG: hypothetical protein U0790_02965 [Isosphaeraceae bacterium]